LDGSPIVFVFHFFHKKAFGDKWQLVFLTDWMPTSSVKALMRSQRTDANHGLKRISSFPGSSTNSRRKAAFHTSCLSGARKQPARGTINITLILILSQRTKITVIKLGDNVCPTSEQM